MRFEWDKETGRKRKKLINRCNQKKYIDSIQKDSNIPNTSFQHYIGQMTKEITLTATQ